MRSADVYVSYSSAQIDVAFNLVTYLEELGISCWIAPRDISEFKAGEVYSDVVYHAINNCRAYVVLINRSASISQTVWHEFELALSRKKHDTKFPIIPVKTENFHIPERYDFYLSNYFLINGYSVPFSTWARKVYRSIRQLLRQSAGTVPEKENNQRKTISRNDEMESLNGVNSRILSINKSRRVPYEGRESFVFISYSRLDKETVMQIVKGLQDKNCRIWYDAGIHPGADWDDFVASKIEECGFLIAFISKNFINSENCKDELNYARDKNKKRLLVYLDDTTLPRGMAMRLNRIQAIQRNTYQKHNELVDLIMTADSIELFCN